MTAKKTTNLNNDFLKKRQDDVTARLRRHGVVELEIRASYGFRWVPEEQGPLKAVLGYQNLDGVLADEEDVTSLITNLEQMEMQLLSFGEARLHIHARNVSLCLAHNTFTNTLSLLTLTHTLSHLTQTQMLTDTHYLVFPLNPVANSS